MPRKDGSTKQKQLPRNMQGETAFKIVVGQPFNLSRTKDITRVYVEGTATTSHAIFLQAVYF